SFRLQDRPEALDLLARLQQAQDDLAHLFDDVRNYASPIRLEPRPCDLADVWRQAWSDLAEVRARQNVELREDAADVDLPLTADPFQLRQVFRNLLENALSAGPEAADIVIRCTEVELNGQEAVQVSVTDQGPGFTAEQRQRAFEPFYTTKLRGTGLGLAICKRIVEAHGGRITVAEGAGPGATVLVTLPRSTP